MDIILYHNTPSPHIEHCIRSIRHYSPRSPLHVVGHDLNVPHIDHAPYYQRAAEFKAIYFQESQNSYNLEFNAFARWIVMEDYCRQNGIAQFAHFDCDTIVCCDMDVESERWKTFDMTWPLCSGVFYNLEVLRFMNRVTFDYFRHVVTPETDLVKKWKADCGHVSDMVLWHLAYHHFKSVNSADGVVQLGTNLHHVEQLGSQLHEPEGYVIDEQGYRKLTIENGQAFVHKVDGTPVRMLTIHCWGIYKTRMKETLDRLIGPA